MELNKNNESKNRGRKTASSVLLAGLILCTLVIVIFSYATSNHIISNATAQNTPPKKPQQLWNQPKQIFRKKQSISGKTTFLL